MYTTHFDLGVNEPGDGREQRRRGDHQGATLRQEA